MHRTAALALATALLAATGCMTDGEWSARKALGWDDDKPRFDPKTVPQASIETASRVEVLGRRIVAQNTFTGIEPMIFTIGVKEPALFHRGPEELFISEGLVNQCKTDEQLAAVLCAELGQMVAEKRNARAVGRNVDPVADENRGAGPRVPGGTAFDAGQQASLAFHEKQHPRAGRGADATDAQKSARDLLKGAGFDPAELDKVQPLLKQSDRGELLRKQMAAPAAPTWQR